MKIDSSFFVLLAGSSMLAACAQFALAQPAVAGELERPEAVPGVMTAASAAVVPAQASAMPEPLATDAPGRAKQAAMAFATTLKGQLKQQIKTQGLVSAIGFCHQEAPKIATAVGQKYQVSLGRVPVPGRIRNPANAPAGWQAGVVERFAGRAGAGEDIASLVSMQTESLPAGVAARFARAIPVEEGCLACHGKTVKPEIAAALREHYPNDQATGFSAGELRGLLWVEVPQAALKH